MELVVGLLVFLVLVFGLGGWFAIWLISRGKRTREVAEGKAPAILDAAFDGRDDVVFKVNLESPSYETVVLGAKARGYVLTHETNDTPGGEAKTLIFQKD